MDVSPIRRQIGKGQPGGVLRNLLLQVSNTAHRKKGDAPPQDWQELAGIIERWFSVKIHEPEYDSAADVHITVEYEKRGKKYDIISGGSGFHQTLTLLAFFSAITPQRFCSMSRMLISTSIYSVNSWTISSGSLWREGCSFSLRPTRRNWRAA